MISRVFAYSHGRKYLAATPDTFLERTFTARTPEGILRYYVFDSDHWKRYVIVLVRQLDGLYRVYYRRRDWTATIRTQRLAELALQKPVRTIPKERLPELLEPRNIHELEEADKWLPHVEPAADAGL